jgi:hypothetical protein
MRSPIASQQPCSPAEVANASNDHGNQPENQPLTRLVRILVATVLGVLIIFAWVGLPFEIPYIGYGLASAFFFQVAVRPRRWEILAVILGAGILIFFDHLVVRRGSIEGFQFSVCLGMRPGQLSGTRL